MTAQANTARQDRVLRNVGVNTWMDRQIHIYSANRDVGVLCKIRYGVFVQYNRAIDAHQTNSVATHVMDINAEANA